MPACSACGETWRTLQAFKAPGEGAPVIQACNDKKSRDTCANVNGMMLKHHAVGPPAQHCADGRSLPQTPHLVLGVVDIALQPTQRIQALPPGSPLASMSCTTRPFALQASLWMLSSAVPLAVWTCCWGALLQPVAVSPALPSSAGGDLNRAKRRNKGQLHLMKTSSRNLLV